MPKASLPGFTCAYDDRGRGVPVVWIHGFPFHRGMWAPQVETLSDAGRMVAPDLRGFGESSRTSGPYTMERYADDVVALLDALGLESAVVAGLSMGGYVAFALARRHRRRVRGLVLADTRPEPDSPEARATRRETAALVRRKGVSVLVDALLPKLVSETTARGRPEVVARIRAMMEAAEPESVAAALTGMAERPDARDLLPDLRIPTCVIVGADDAITPPDTARAIAAGIPGARLVVLPQAGHVSNLEDPDTFSGVVREFLSQFR